MQDRYIAAVDFGSSVTSLSVAKIEGNDIQIHYYKELPSKGVARGAIIHPKQASAILQKLVEDANSEIGITITQVVVAKPRYRLEQEHTSAIYNLDNPDEYISANDIEHLKNLAVDEYEYADNEKRQIYGAVAQSFSVEEPSIVTESDIVGSCSSYIEGHFSFYIGQRSAIKNIVKTLNEAGLALAKDVFVPTTTAKAVLTEDEMECGVALIEIGGDITSVTIYKGKRLKYYSSIPFGGKTITNDICGECGFLFPLAENIKLAYGSCTPGNLGTLTEKTLQINNTESGSFDRLTIKYLSEIIEERTKEIIEATLYMIQESGFAYGLRKGVVLTGGGAKLSGIKTLFKNMSGYDVRLGYPCANKFRVNGVPMATELSSSSNIGMILSAQYDNQLNCINNIEEEDRIVETPVADTSVNETPVAKKEEKVEQPTIFESEMKVDSKPKKPKKEGKTLTWPSMLGKKLGNGLEKVFEATLGSYYGDMK